MPHPDDEAVFISGLLYQLSQDHIPTRVITCTRGEASTLRYGLSPRANLAKARYKELTQAFSILGINDFQILSLPDGGLGGKRRQIVALIKHQLHKFNPTCVITLEPDGIYGHPDHVALSHFVTQTVPANLRVLYATVRPNFTLPKAAHMAKITVINPALPDYQFNLSSHHIFIKIKTILTHHSQFKIALKKIPEIIFFISNRIPTHEYFANRFD